MKDIYIRDINEKIMELRLSGLTRGQDDTLDDIEFAIGQLLKEIEK